MNTRRENENAPVKILRRQTSSAAVTVDATANADAEMSAETSTSAVTSTSSRTNGPARSLSTSASASVSASASASASAASASAGRRGSPAFTHFLSLPLRHAPVLEALVAWQDEVLAKFGRVQGMDPSILVGAQTFHVTLGMLALPTAELVARAATVLRSQSARIYDILQTRTLLVTVRGLRIMKEGRAPRADPATTAAAADGARPGQRPRWADVVYFEVHEAESTNRLLPMIGMLTFGHSMGMARPRAVFRADKRHVGRRIHVRPSPPAGCA